jgi:thymidine kinase
MSLDIYTGPMFAGKSSAVLGILRRHKFIGIKTLCITSSLDTRYADNSIVTHAGERYPATAVGHLMPLLQTPEFAAATHIIIEEAQFFQDLKRFALCAANIKKKHVICVGLDGDSVAEPFGQLLELVPHCNIIHKFRALCSKCRNGTEAIYTCRKSGVPEQTEQICVGGADQYEALCRDHYMDSTIESLRDESAQMQKYLEDYIAPVAESPKNYLEYLLRFVGFAKCGEYLLKMYPLRPAENSATVVEDAS